MALGRWFSIVRRVKWRWGAWSLIWFRETIAGFSAISGVGARGGGSGGSVRPCSNVHAAPSIRIEGVGVEGRGEGEPRERGEVGSETRDESIRWRVR